MPAWLTWTLTAVLMLLGLAGAALPGVPGTPLIFLAALLHKLFLPRLLPWWTVAVLGALACVAMFMDAVFAAAGGRRFGATRWGVLGAVFGATFGVFWGPFGIFLGAAAGAVASELVFAGRHLEAAFKAGAGTVLGMLVAGVGRVLIALTMIALFFLGCLLR